VLFYAVASLAVQRREISDDRAVCRRARYGVIAIIAQYQKEGVAVLTDFPNNVALDRQESYID
jgi:hypothetical protein